MSPRALVPTNVATSRVVRQVAIELDDLAEHGSVVQASLGVGKI